ncbi:MAG TPA: chemotaxis protein [Anaeromyxobacter sp.]|nr:chemotaxis protein [Anaeromyxobacter sp.]
MTRTHLRYDWYGALIGLGLPLLGTAIEALRQFQSLSPPALVHAHLGQPLLWIMDTTPVVLGLLGRIILVQQDTVVRQSRELVDKSQALVRAELARREGFEATAGRLFHAAQGLLGTVSDFTATSGEAATSARRVTEALTGVSQAASAAALTAETVIGIGVQAERASAEGLEHVEAAGAELLRLAEEVREFTSAIERLRAPLEELRAQSAAVNDTSEEAERLSEAAERICGGAGPQCAELATALKDHAGAVRRAAAGLKLVLSDAQGARDAAGRAAQAGGERATAAARVASRTSATIRGLAVSLRDSARAAREIARAAQQQEGDIEQVLKAMNEIAHATAGTVASTQFVEREARSLNDLAGSLRDAVRGERGAGPIPGERTGSLL